MHLKLNAIYVCTDNICNDIFKRFRHVELNFIFFVILYILFSEIRQTFQTVSITVEGQCHKIFDIRWLAPKFYIWAPYEQAKTVLRTFCYLIIKFEIRYSA